jgi:hypothetical protein
MSKVQSALLKRLLFDWALETLKKLPADRRGPGLDILSTLLLETTTSTPAMVSGARDIAIQTLQNTKLKAVVESMARVCAATSPQGSCENALATAMICLEEASM